MKRNIKLDLDLGNSEWLSNVWKTGFQQWYFSFHTYKYTSL